MAHLRPTIRNLCRRYSAADTAIALLAPGYGILHSQVQEGSLTLTRAREISTAFLHLRVNVMRFSNTRNLADELQDENQREGYVLLKEWRKMQIERLAVISYARGVAFDAVRFETHVVTNGDLVQQQLRYLYRNVHSMAPVAAATMLYGRSAACLAVQHHEMPLEMFREFVDLEAHHWLNVPLPAEESEVAAPLHLAHQFIGRTSPAVPAAQ